MKKISIIVIILLLLVVIGLGIYKFNFKNNDIGVENGIYSQEEEDESITKLKAQTWTLIETNYDGGEIKPISEKKFTLSLNDKNFSATTDCNTLGGEYAVTNERNIYLSNISSTKMYCEGSQEGDFIKTLGEVGDYIFTSDGELIFHLKTSDGWLIFK